MNSRRNALLDRPIVPKPLRLTLPVIAVIHAITIVRHFARHDAFHFALHFASQIALHFALNLPDIIARMGGVQRISTLASTLARRI
jgi:hypothetical protein